MISLPHLFSAVREAIVEEKRVLQGAVADPMQALTPTVLTQAVRRKVFSEREAVFNELITEFLIDHTYKIDESVMVFRFGSGKHDAEYLLLEVLVNPDAKAFAPAVQKYFTGQYKNCRAIVCQLHTASEQDTNNWWRNYEQALLGNLHLAAGPHKLDQIHRLDRKPEVARPWLLYWEVFLPEDKPADTNDLAKALKDAVLNMRYENLLAVVRKIISLRTNISEEHILEDQSLSHLFKQAFAKEQGVNVEEVYDPEAMAGITDSQLASINLVNDLQKTFCVHLEPDEVHGIRTLRDLVEAISWK